MAALKANTMEEKGQKKKRLRTGYTTGTCSAAAAKAATLLFLSGKLPEKVSVSLPNGKVITLPVEPPPIRLRNPGATVVKDAGDDPDCTNGAKITVEVKPIDANDGQIKLKAGQGVGIVTLPGLGIDVGEPSITKVPRQMIEKAIKEVYSGSLEVTIHVPGGEDMAKQTTNSRLGIVGGISILGTSGIVKPFSTASYRASIVQQIDIAKARGSQEIVFAVGSRSDAFAQKYLPHLAKVAFVEVGDFTGLAIKRASLKGFKHAYFFGMAGKITKLAANIMMTHYSKSNVSTELLFDVANLTNAPEQIKVASTYTNTARHFCEKCLELGFLEPLFILCKRAKENCENFAGKKIELDVFMLDFEGRKIIAKS